MTHVVCYECRYVYERPYDTCPTCGDPKRHGPFQTKIEAEAKAMGLWLKDGYSIHDIRDPYFNPRF
tara:strand:- start:1147 stop:1344 length:198 start_codon:yes stop_codon:yes gene_type:complete